MRNSVKVYYILGTWSHIICGLHVLTAVNRLWYSVKIYLRSITNGDHFLKQNAWVCLNQAEITDSCIVRHEELLNPVSSNEYRMVQHQIPFIAFKTKVKN